MTTFKEERLLSPYFNAQITAQIAFHRALRNGLLKRPDKCSRCGLIGKIEGHHPDYDKPLEVIWLCRKCHRSER